MNRLLQWLLKFTVASTSSLLLCVGSSTLAAQTLRITSPADGAVVHPGQNLTVVVEASGANFQMVTVIGQDPIGFGPVLTAQPYRFTIQIPAQISPRRYTLTASGVTSPGHGASSTPVSIDIERPDAPASVVVEPSLLDVQAGEPGYLRAVATYDDGITLDISQSLLTTWSSDNTDVATVTNDGRVATFAPGFAKITIENGGRIAVVPVKVRKSAQ